MTRCATCGHEAETWADIDTPVGTGRVWLCSDCLDDERLPKLSWVQAAELAMAYHAIDGHDPEHCSGCADEREARAARGV
jgi:hypothetical protein